MNKLDKYIIFFLKFNSRLMDLEKIEKEKMQGSFLLVRILFFVLSAASTFRYILKQIYNDIILYDPQKLYNFGNEMQNILATRSWEIC